MNASRTRWLVLALVVLGFILRLGLALKLGIHEPPGPGSDSQEYDTYAWNVAQGRGFRGMSPDVTDRDHLTAYHPPGTSLVWAGLYGVVGHRHDAVRVLHGLVGAATIALVYLIGCQTFGRPVGLLAAAGFAVWPFSLFYSAELLSEPLGTFWLLAYVAAALEFAARPGAVRAVVAGLLLGLALLTRGNVVLLMPLTLVWAVVQFRRRPRALAWALAIPMVALATVAPWTIRNYRVFGAFVPLSTGAGDVLLGSNNRLVVTDPDYYGYWVFPDELPEYREPLKAPNDELVRDRLESKLAVEWVQNNQDQWWYLLHSKFRRLWTPFLQPRSPRLHRIGTLVAWGPVLVLFALAFVPTGIAWLRRGHPGWLIHLVILSVVLNALVFWGSSRFRYPIEGLCLILAGAAVVGLVQWVGNRRPAPAVSSSAAA
ncbi:MAG TPA: glycosyltransferase family 39 protein [Isosphaeraceae bacterium]|nr:glycosyltransferase family 39 protein [Isosphaeraceae bacterium]